MKEIRRLALVATAIVGVHVFHGVHARESCAVTAAHFTPLRVHLPTGARVGYLFDSTLLDAATGRGVLARQERFLCAMQALAPRFLLIGMEPEFVLFDGSPGDTGLPPATHSIVVDLGNGVRLWRRR